VCPWTMVGSFRMNFPRRFSDFGMKRACAQRLQAVFRRTEPHMHYRQMIPAGVCIGGGAMRALCEWKYRRVLTRKSLQKDMPATVRRRMFVDVARLDPLNTATYEGWMATFRRLQGLCAENHEAKRIEADTKAAYKELVDYEARLYNDIERGGGGGLVRTLGGVKVHVPATRIKWPASLALRDSCMHAWRGVAEARARHARAGRLSAQTAQKKLEESQQRILTLREKLRKASASPLQGVPAASTEDAMAVLAGARVSVPARRGRLPARRERDRRTARRVPGERARCQE
jgi:hypothetical protein